MKRIVLLILTLLVLAGCNKQSIVWVHEPDMEFDDVYVLAVHPDNPGDYEEDSLCGVSGVEIPMLKPAIMGHYDYGNVFVRVGDNYGAYNHDGINVIPVDKEMIFYQFLETKDRTFSGKTYVSLIKPLDSSNCASLTKRTYIPGPKDTEMCLDQEGYISEIRNYGKNLTNDSVVSGSLMNGGCVFGATPYVKDGTIHFDDCLFNKEACSPFEVPLEEVLGKTNGAFITNCEDGITKCIVNKQKEIKPIDKQYSLYLYISDDGMISNKYSEDVVDIQSTEFIVNNRIMSLNSGNKIVYLDLDANQISKEYDSGYHFSDGLAAVKKDNKWGYIDESGNEVIPFVFEEARPLYEGKAYVKVNGKWGILDIKKSLENKADFNTLVK